MILLRDRPEPRIPTHGYYYESVNDNISDLCAEYNCIGLVDSSGNIGPEDYIPMTSDYMINCTIDNNSSNGIQMPKDVTFTPIENTIE